MKVAAPAEPRPFGPGYLKNSRRAPTDEHSSPCVHCGRPVPNALRHTVVIVDGGARYGTPQDDENDPGHMGAHPVGADCARRLRRAGIWVHIRGKTAPSST